MTPSLNRLHMSRRLTPAAAALALLAAVACGSSDGDPAATRVPAAVPTATPAAATAAPVTPTTTPAEITQAPPATQNPKDNAGDTPGGGGTEAAVNEAPRSPTGPPPAVDLTQRSVDPTGIVFDTFNGGSVRLPDASEQLIDRLRNAIQPIYLPAYDPVDGGAWMDDDDLVIGYESGGESFAYPVKILNFHELVSDVIDDVPVLISYCPLCGSGVVYDRRLNGETLLFGNTSALYENDLVMFDYNTGSYWFQTAAEAIVGPLSTRRLEPLPATTITWGTWKETHPDTKVLSREQPEIEPTRRPNYTRDPFAGGAYERSVDALRFPFPVTVDNIDNRLRPSEIAISILIGAAEKAYPIQRLGDAVVNDEFAGQPVVVFSQSRGPNGNGFSRDVGGKTLTFRLDGERIVDNETGSEWDFSGLAVSGDLEGEELTLITARRAFWFSLAFAVPDIPLYEVAE